MKIESQLLEDHQIKLKVEIESGPFEDAKRRAAREIAKRSKIPGFRPGKAPYHVVERYAGPQAILADAMDMLVKDIYPKMIEEAGIKPYGPGSLENVSTEPPVFEFVVPLEAEVTLGEYGQVRLPYEPKTVTDEDVNRVFENMRAQQAVIEPVERPAQEGDLVTVKLSAERKQVEEGEEAALIRERSYPLIVQAEKPAKEAEAAPEAGEDVEEDGGAESAEWPFPGFSHHLIGLSAGDEKTIPYTYPEDSPFEMLRGKEADFHFVVESVKSRTLPELDDEFARSQGEYENREALLTEIHTRLQEQMSAEYQNEYNDKIIQEVVSQSTVKYPPQMLEEEVHSLVHRLEDRLQQQKMDLETYLKTRQMDQKALEEELQPSAESRLKQFLVLYEIARAENIQVDEAEVMTQASQTIDQLSKSVPPEQARKSLTPNFLDTMTRSITADLLLRNTVNRLHAVATGEAEAAAESAASAETATSTEATVSEEIAPADAAVTSEEAASSEEPVSAEAASEAASDQADAGLEEAGEPSSAGTQAVETETEPVEVVPSGESGASEADRTPAEKPEE